MRSSAQNQVSSRSAHRGGMVVGLANLDIFPGERWHGTPELIAQLHVVLYRFFASCGDAKEPLASAAALMGGFCQVRLEVAFVLQSAQGDMYRAHRHGTSCTFFEFLPDGDTIGLRVEVGDHEHEQLFKFSEVGSLHRFSIFTNVVIESILTNTKFDSEGYRQM